MKKWIYLVFPGIMLGIFLIFFTANNKERQERSRIQMEAKAKKEADEKRAKEEAERLAREDAARKQQERDAEAKAKEDERIAKQAKVDAEIKADTDAARAETERFANEAKALEAELERTRKEIDQQTRATFDLAKQVEMAKVARRNAELETQRMVEMISHRAAQSLMANPPPPPPPPPARS